VVGLNVKKKKMCIYFMYVCIIICVYMFLYTFITKNYFFYNVECGWWCVYILLLVSKGFDYSTLIKKFN